MKFEGKILLLRMLHPSGQALEEFTRNDLTDSYLRRNSYSIIKIPREEHDKSHQVLKIMNQNIDFNGKISTRMQ